jgi:hypothetical protein
MADRITSYAKFWPYYLREHSKAATRGWHFVGTNLSVALLVGSIAAADWRFAVAALVSAYGLAWFSHFFIEKNRPATFSYPGWSFISDFRMCALMWMGRLGPEVARHVPAS